MSKPTAMTQSARSTAAAAQGLSLEAVANLYRDAANILAEGQEAEAARHRLPTVEDGFDGVAAVSAAVNSASAGSIWSQVRRATG